MKPAPFEYDRPETLDEALDLLSRHGDEAKILAGGQSLVPVMSFRLAQPARLIDVNRLGELDFLEPTPDGGLRIGALVRQRRLERDPIVARRQPLLAAAAPWVAHPQIRNRGTFGGSLAHADPAAEMPAVAVALDARLELRRGSGRRTVGAGEFFTGLFSTVLEADEMLTAVELPPMPPKTGVAFLELARRHGDYALVGVAATVTLDGRKCRRARLVFLSAGDRPVDAHEAAAALAGEKLSDGALAAAAEAADAAIAPEDDIHATATYKRRVARVLTARALRAAWARAEAA